MELALAGGESENANWGGGMWRVVMAKRLLGFVSLVLVSAGFAACGGGSGGSGDGTGTLRVSNQYISQYCETELITITGPGFSRDEVSFLEPDQTQDISLPAGVYDVEVEYAGVDCPNDTFMDVTITAGGVTELPLE